MLVGQVLIEVSNVELFLEKLDMSISPSGLGGFLVTRADPYIRLRAEKRFIQEGDEVSGRWDQLLEHTNYIREKKGFPAQHPINVRTGEMKRFVTGEGDVLMTGDGATLVAPGGEPSLSLEEKLRTAQFGKAKPHTVPRPVIGVGPTDMQAVLTLLMVHIGEFVDNV